MGSLDVDSLFTNIPLEETNDICPNTLFKNTEGVKVLSKKKKKKKLLSPATKESYFVFNGKLYKQVDGVAFRSGTSYLFFLYTLKRKKGKTFTTSVYRKPTFSGVYTHSDRFLPSSYKLGTVYTLSCRWFQIYSSWTKLHTELECLK